ncbi:Zinc finger CCHC domain-containing protein 8 homolog [Eumeta japonica]|uniref:Zinc finger CCHC domain-containing protein 8 homolog n=1 Tax=Eumeta variegata TaxID=151549 RepID=A0A4C1TLW9_EUMVA|nr:Zinc finger CCHC domain-containing protein 8 homolog [Eumeta japonica]
MSKRKAVVKDIIYELDTEDVESSSEDEKDVKKNSNGVSVKTKSFNNKNVMSDDSCVEVVDMVVDSSDDEVIIHTKESNENQVGKIPEKKLKSKSGNNTIDSCILMDNGETGKIVKAVLTNDSAEQILTDNISLNSPTSTSSLNAIASCQNRTPLLSIHFKNKKMASIYKEKIKKFMLNLIKLHEEETGSENETDLELDIWPEDLPQQNEEAKEEQDSIFFIDTEPSENESVDVPKYSKVDAVLSNVPNEETLTPGSTKKQQICFNCDGAHQLKDCSKPRNNIRIAEKRKAMNANRVGRYHIEDDQKYGHLVPGRISGKLRHALGLKRDELPLFIYRMRLLGYPPGWLEEARICHSGITMFDSTGKAVQEPDDEEGEVIEPGSKDIFDIRKIHDFPGFNVPASSRYKEHAHLYNLPPQSEQDSKLYMLQMLAPNAMRAYKRKKLTFFPSGSPSYATLEGQIEMDLDDGDETPEFPTVPPLPDEEPPAPPPPPPPPPNVPPPPDDLPPLSPKDIPIPLASPHTPDAHTNSIKLKEKTTDNSDKVKEVTPNRKSDDINDELSQDKSDDLIIIDEEDDASQSSSGRDSPSLAYLEEKKRLLLEALISGTGTGSSQESLLPDASSQTSEEKDKTSSYSETSKSQPNSPTVGYIKSTSYGNLVLNTASSYTKLPSEDKFAKNICDVIHFENLPDSTGKYEKITNLLKRVKTEVDRIQDS